MLGFLFFIIIFVLIIGLLIISTLFGFIRSLFGFGKRGAQNQNSQTPSHEQPNSKSKIFDKNEGEYVDYEEVK
jgi:hypothetical protein